jgi:toxin HigB-1
MIISFADEETQDIYDNIRSKKSRKRLSIDLFRVAQRKLDMIDSASDIKDLKSPPSNHLEVLKGNLKGMHSIRVNAQYRVVFKWTTKGAEKVKITDYH